MKGNKKHHGKHTVKAHGKKQNHKSVEPERGFLPYCRRFMNTWRQTYKDIYSL